MAVRIIRRLLQLFDVNADAIADGETLVWDAGTSKFVPGAGGGGGAPTTADYLVGTAQAGLSAEIVVGATPGGELGGTWGSPTVDTVHSGSSHAAVQSAAEATAAAALSAHLTDAADAHDASAISFVPTGSIAATDVQAAIAEAASEAALPAWWTIDSTPGSEEVKFFPGPGSSLQSGTAPFTIVPHANTLSEGYLTFAISLPGGDPDDPLDVMLGVAADATLVVKPVPGVSGAAISFYGDPTGLASSPVVQWYGGDSGFPCEALMVGRAGQPKPRWIMREDATVLASIGSADAVTASWLTVTNTGKFGVFGVVAKAQQAEPTTINGIVDLLQAYGWSA